MVKKKSTCWVRARLRVERRASGDDLVGDDAVAVDVAFLGHPLSTKVLRRCPHVWKCGRGGEGLVAS